MVKQKNKKNLYIVKYFASIVKIFWASLTHQRLLFLFYQITAESTNEA